MSFAFLGLIIYMIVNLGIELFYKEQLTYLVSVGNLNIENQYEALVLRNELIVDTNLNGKITYFASEGEVVEKNSQIAEIFNDGTQTAQETEDEKELNRKKIEYDYNLLEYDITTIKNEILFNMSNGNYELIPALKEQLDNNLERLSKLQGDNKFLSNRTASYSEKTIGEGNLMEGQKQAIYAPVSGVITYKSDGYEEFLTIDNVYNINFDEIKTQVFQETSFIKDVVSPKDKLFKIVDHANYYIAAIVTNDEIQTYKNVKQLSVNIDGKKYVGEVFDVFTNKQNAVAIIQLREGFDSFFNRRLIQCSITCENYRGLKVYMDSITNVDDKIGVYVVDKERKLRFVPVKTIAYDDEFAIVYNEQFYDGENLVRSIKLNQEIVRNASRYKEGDRID